MTGWTTQRRARVALVAVLALLLAYLFFAARRALMPLAAGTVVAYIMLPLINWLDARTRPALRQRRLLRTLLVLVVYSVTVSIVVSFVGALIPPIGAQVGSLARRLPILARNVREVAPELVQDWLDTYTRFVPENIRLAIQHSVDNTLQAVLNSLQAGVFKGVSVVFSTLGFVIGLLVVPLWMFYVLRDQPEASAQFYRSISPRYREDARHIMALVDRVLSSYLRGQLILCLSVGVMTTVGLTAIGIDLALLLGTLAGIFEVVPTLGPILAAIPAILVTLATAPSQLLWVIVLALAVQQIENLFLVPQVAGGTVRIHPALAMLALLIGSEVAGVLGVILSMPVTAIVRDVAHYVLLRLQDESLSPDEAFQQVYGGLLSSLADLSQRTRAVPEKPARP